MKLSELNNPKYIAFESLKKNGDPVNTPLWVVEDNGNLYAWTDDGSWKVKRVRNNPTVRVAASDARGVPNGEWVDAQAQINDSAAEEERIRKMLSKKYGITFLMIRVFNWFRRSGRTTVIEIRDI